MRRTDTRPSVLDRLTIKHISIHTLTTNAHASIWQALNLLRDTKLPQIMPDHLRLDLDLIELLARVDANDTSNHLRHDNHIAQMCLDEVGLLVRLRFLLSFAQLLDQTHGFTLEAAVEAAAGAGVNNVAKLFGGEVEESGV